MHVLEELRSQAFPIHPADVYLENYRARPQRDLEALTSDSAVVRPQHICIKKRRGECTKALCVCLDAPAMATSMDCRVSSWSVSVAVSNMTQTLPGLKEAEGAIVGSSDGASVGLIVGWSTSY